MEKELLAGLGRPVTVMTVFPHPDDESFAAGGTLALFARESEVRCVSLCLTKGGKSGALKKVGLPESREPEIREREYLASTAILGVDQALLWDYEDQGLPTVPEPELRGRLVKAMQEAGAEVVITYGPDGVTGHEDHVTCSRVTAAAARQAGVKRLYLVSAPVWLGRIMLRKKLLPPTHAIDIRSVYPVKMLALKAHASQMLISRTPMIWVGGVMRMFGAEFFHRAGFD